MSQYRCRFCGQYARKLVFDITDLLAVSEDQGLVPVHTCPQSRRVAVQTVKLLAREYGGVNGNPRFLPFGWETLMPI